MKRLIRTITVLLLSACFAQGAWAQFNVSGPGFLPDENGTNLDAPAQRKISPGTIIKDCPECPEMVVIPSGTYAMGFHQNVNEQPTHSVSLRSFLMGKTEVTQAQWEAVMGNKPSKNKGRMLPVENVSWDDVQQFITTLNTSTGQKYRLPSEAEWEYSARAGTTTDWSFGNDESLLSDYAWHEGNSGGMARVVGQKLPNPFGLFDMHGNVWEWTQDCWHGNYTGAPTDGSAWTTGCTVIGRVIRGGSWYSGGPAYLRSAIRIRLIPGSRYDYLGFRLARDMSVSKPAALVTLEKPVGSSSIDTSKQGDGIAANNKIASTLKQKSPDSTQFEYSYFPLDYEFIVNLKKSKRVMTIDIAIKTRYEKRVSDNVKKHELALRGAMLDIMRTTTESDLKKTDFRTELAAKLRDAMNILLEKYENFGGIEELILSGVVVQ